MKKEKLNTHNEQCFIYEATNENLKTFKNHPRKLISDDKKYLLLYTEIILKELHDYYDWLFEKNQIAQSSTSDLEYETLLSTEGIKKQFDPELYAETFSKIDESLEKVIFFVDSEMPFKDVICNLKELSTGKALAKFVMLAFNVKDQGKSVKEAKPTGYFTFTKRGSN